MSTQVSEFNTLFKQYKRGGLQHAILTELLARMQKGGTKYWLYNPDDEYIPEKEELFQPIYFNGNKEYALIMSMKYDVEVLKCDPLQAIDEISLPTGPILDVFKTNKRLAVTGAIEELLDSFPLEAVKKPLIQ